MTAPHRWLRIRTVHKLLPLANSMDASSRARGFLMAFAHAYGEPDALDESVRRQRERLIEATSKRYPMWDEDGSPTWHHVRLVVEAAWSPNPKRLLRWLRRDKASFAESAARSVLGEQYVAPTPKPKAAPAPQARYIPDVVDRMVEDFPGFLASLPRAVPSYRDRKRA